VIAVFARNLSGLVRLGSRQLSERDAKRKANLPPKRDIAGC